MLLSFAKWLPLSGGRVIHLGLTLTRDSPSGLSRHPRGQLPKGGPHQPFTVSDRAGGNSLHRRMADEECTCTLCDEATFETGTFRLLVAQ